MVLQDESIDKIMDGSPYKADTLKYMQGQGPIDITVVDPLNVKPADFVLKFYSGPINGSPYTGDFDKSRWFMVDKNNPGDTIFSENTIEVANEQIVPEYGIAVNIGQYSRNPVDLNAPIINFYPDLFGSSIEFSEGPGEWLVGVPDQESQSPLNWIRSGSIVLDTEEGSEAPCFELPDGRIDPFVFNDYQNVDIDQIFEDVIGGTFAPARLVGALDCLPAPINRDVLGDLVSTKRDLSLLTSIEIFITPDKERWSRVPVFEMQNEPALAQFNKEDFSLRGDLSVDKNGRNQLDPEANVDECTLNGNQVVTQAVLDNMSDPEIANLLANLDQEYPGSVDPEGSSDQLLGLSFGMGYFPGYALNPETGERLNMAFGENSLFASDNGRDMLWNPSPRLITQSGENFVAGGEHYVYTFRNAALAQEDDELMPMYDEGQYVWNQLNLGIEFFNSQVFGALGWIYWPLLNQSQLFEYKSPEEGLVPGNVRLSAYVGRPYTRYATTVNELGDESFPFTPVEEELDLSSNFWYPMYEFTLDGLDSQTNQTEVAQNALDLIDIVPNPYYAYSSYEQSRVDNRVKFVNLPPEAKIQIFTMNGTLVRVLEKDNPNTFLEWNLQNEFFIPIAGGMYLIHVESPGLGERVLKFFAATRPADLRNF
jgi:hypothetical protein